MGMDTISVGNTIGCAMELAERGLIDSDLKFGRADLLVETDEDVTDVFIGARYLHQFSDRWGASIRGDYSFGDSEGTLNLLASVGFRVAGPFALQLGYRYASIEFEEDLEQATVTTEITLDGPYLGFVFRF